MESAWRYNLRSVVLTKGENGSIIYSQERNRLCYRSGYSVSSWKADTIGAGDAITGVFAIGVLKKYDFACINRHANRIVVYVRARTGGCTATNFGFRDRKKRVP